MKYRYFLLIFVVVIISTGCVSENKEITVTPTPIPDDTVKTISLSPTLPAILYSAVPQNGIIEYKNAEKIVRPEDLQTGDLIQMPIDDSRYDKDHAWIIENIFPQNNQFVIKEITRFKPENRWFGMETTISRVITSGALMRDYPYKIGHASKPLPQKCMVCGYTYGNDVDRWCTQDYIRFIDCDDLRINNSSSPIINPP